MLIPEHFSKYIKFALLLDIVREAISLIHEKDEILEYDAHSICVDNIFLKTTPIIGM